MKIIFLYFFLKKNLFFFFTNFHPKPRARIKEEDLHLCPALNPFANKLWSPALFAAHNEGRGYGTESR